MSSPAPEQAIVAIKGPYVLGVLLHCTYYYYCIGTRNRDEKGMIFLTNYSGL